jgi:hypothetical protein
MHRGLKPLLELFILVCIVNQGVGGIKDDVHALPVGKALEERLEFSGGGFETTVLCEI